jgi:hypothetical protein
MKQEPDVLSSSDLPFFLPYFLVTLLVRTHNHHVAGFTSFAGLFGRFFESAHDEKEIGFSSVK